MFHLFFLCLFQNEENIEKFKQTQVSKILLIHTFYISKEIFMIKQNKFIFQISKELIMSL